MIFNLFEIIFLTPKKLNLEFYCYDNSGTGKAPGRALHYRWKKENRHRSARNGQWITPASNYTCN